MKMLFIPYLLTPLLAVMIAAPTVVIAAQPTVKLGTTSTYAVLAGSIITNTVKTTIGGDVGLFPGTSFTGQANVTTSGAIHIS